MKNNKQISNQLKNNIAANHYSIVTEHCGGRQICWEYNNCDEASDAYDQKIINAAKFQSRSFMEKFSRVTLYDSYGKIWHELKMTYNSENY